MDSDSRPFAAWARAQPEPVRAAFLRAWRIAGVSLEECEGASVLCLGRAAARLRRDGMVDTTAFLHRHPAGGAPSLSEAAWDSKGGAVFTDGPGTGVPHPLDGAGMAAARDGWADFLDALRVGLSSREGGPDFLVSRPGRALAYGRAAPVRVRVREDLAGEVRRILGEHWRGAARRVMEEWRSRLDPGTLAAMGGAGLNDPGAWNWLARGPRRVQAVAFAPWAAPDMMSRGWGPAIDAGRPLAEALGREYGVAPSLVRRIRGMPARGQPARLLSELGTWPPQARLPEGRAGWEGFLGLRGHGVEEESLLALCEGASPGEWEECGEELAAHAPEVEPMRAMLRESLVIPLSDAAGVPPPEAERAAVFRSPRRLLAFLRHHAPHGADALAQVLAAGSPDVPSLPSDSWPRLHEGTWTAANGLVMRPLGSGAELSAEAKAMSHCVDGYKDACMFTQTHILSLRRPDGRPVATVEVDGKRLAGVPGSRAESFSPQPLRPEWVRQFKGVRNSDPPWEAWVALWDWASAVATGRVEVNAGGLEQALSVRLRSRGRSAPPTCPARARAVLRAYGELLGKSARRALASLGRQGVGAA